jgi:hypothetical protein
MGVTRRNIFRGGLVALATAVVSGASPLSQPAVAALCYSCDPYHFVSRDAYCGCQYSPNNCTIGCYPLYCRDCYDIGGLYCHTECYYSTPVCTGSVCYTGTCTGAYLGTCA